MLFYKLKGNHTKAYFRTDTPLYTAEEATRYAMDNGIIDKSEEKFEVTTVSSDEYREHLISKAYRVFSEHLSKLKQSWIGRPIDEICSECYRAVYIGDIMNVLDNTDPLLFEYEALEKWLKNPEKFVNKVCDRLVYRDNSSYNEEICDYINQGWEE